MIKGTKIQGSLTIDDLRRDSLKAWHFLYKRGFIEGFGHMSARLPGADQFLITRHFLGPRPNPEDFLLVDMKGRICSGTGELPGEFPIHHEILKARPDVNCVIHYHGMYSTAFTTSEHQLRPIHLMGTLFHSGIPVYPDSRLVHDAQRGAELARTLGPHRVALMKGHGVAMTGANIQEGTGGAFLFEENAHRAWISAAMGKPVWLDVATVAACAAELYPYRRVWAMVENDDAEQAAMRGPVK
jgi:ribulose-5-phosphate 4-epimerase/fuculose-1-phosphate aldolase